jgi:hypothetical protein
VGPKARLDSLEKRKIAFMELIGLYSESRRCDVHAFSRDNAETPILQPSIEWLRQSVMGEFVWRASSGSGVHRLGDLFGPVTQHDHPPKHRDEKQLKLSQLSNSVNGMTHEPT